MVYRRRIYFTEKQKAEIWDRWQRGEPVSNELRSIVGQAVMSSSDWDELKTNLARHKLELVPKSGGLALRLRAHSRHLKVLVRLFSPLRG